jgi:hypothetical protein
VLLVGLALALASSAFAGSVICTTGASLGSQGAMACPNYSSPPFLVTDFVDWGAAPSGSGESGFGDGILNNFSAAPWVARTNTGIGVTVALDVTYGGTDNNLYRADNTIWAWSSTFNGWTSPGASGSGIPGTDTFAGHFGAPAIFSDTPIYGDRLLGTRLGSGGAFVISFSTPVYDVGFRISSGGATINQDFIAYMLAYSGPGETGSLLGVSEINTNGAGVGGTCQGLNNIPPEPCNNAPYFEIGGDGAIRSVVVYTNSPNGTWLDTLQADNGSDNPRTPEPGMLFLVGGGLGLVSIARARKMRRSR